MGSSKKCVRRSTSLGLDTYLPFQGTGEMNHRVSQHWVSRDSYSDGKGETTLTVSFLIRAYAWRENQGKQGPGGQAI